MPDLPPDGTRVIATTLPSLEYDEEAREVRGVLTTHPSPFGPPPMCFVDGVDVDPETVRPVGDEEQGHA